MVLIAISNNVPIPLKKKKKKKNCTVHIIHHAIWLSASSFTFLVCVKIFKKLLKYECVRWRAETAKIGASACHG